jgi:hypothetical protein
VAQIDDPSALMLTRSEPAEKPEIRVKAFLPHVPPQPPAPEPTLILHSVMTGRDVSLATINGQIVKEGGRVEGYLVQLITTDGVDLVNGGKTRHLAMRPLHELPPPARPGAAAEQKDATTQRGKTGLTEDFWKIFDSLEL